MRLASKVETRNATTTRKSWRKNLPNIKSDKLSPTANKSDSVFVNRQQKKFRFPQIAANFRFPKISFQKSFFSIFFRNFFPRNRFPKNLLNPKNKRERAALAFLRIHDYSRVVIFRAVLHNAQAKPRSAELL